jgi:hypothetical protein
LTALAIALAVAAGLAGARGAGGGDGGVGRALIIVGITVGPPRIGLAATIGTIIALNLGVAALIDRFGWFGYDRIAIGWARILGSSCSAPARR